MLQMTKPDEWTQEYWEAHCEAHIQTCAAHAQLLTEVIAERNQLRRDLADVTKSLRERDARVEFLIAETKNLRVSLDVHHRELVAAHKRRDELHAERENLQDVVANLEIGLMEGPCK